jgi:hypothetical protein
MNDKGSGCGGVIVMAVIAFFAWKWIDGGGRWTGWIYPTASDLTQEVRLGAFKSFEECQAGAINALRSMRATDGDYECGRRCRSDASVGLNVCKEMQT